jgi:hypothetical protein
MLPEGAHNRFTDTTYFSLNRGKNQSEIFKQTSGGNIDSAPQSYLVSKFFTPERIEKLKQIALRPKGIFQS